MAEHCAYIVTLPTRKSGHPELIDVATDPEVNRQSVLNVMDEAIRNIIRIDISGGARVGGRRRESEPKPDRTLVVNEERDDGSATYDVAAPLQEQDRWQPIYGYLHYKNRVP